MDGINLIPFLTGQKQGRPHDSLFWRSGPYQTLLAGDWKLQVSENPKKNWLFNLRDDPTERLSLAESDAGRLNEMLTQLAAVNAPQSKPLWPALLEARLAIDHPSDVPDSPDDAYIYWSN